MPLWGSTDTTNAAPKFAGSLVSKAPSNANRDLMFGNTGATGGVFAVDAAETPANEGIAHPGWIYRTVGTGGRAGRVFNETLVAMGSVTGTDANDDAVIKDVTITIRTQPSNANVVGANAATFSVTAASSPNTAMTYQWYANTGAGFVALTNVGVYSNVTTSALSISSATGLNGVQYRVDVGAPAANTKTSRRAVLTVS
jgi:hypothetical protein